MSSVELGRCSVALSSVNLDTLYHQQVSIDLTLWVDVIQPDYRQAEITDQIQMLRMQASSECIHHVMVHCSAAHVAGIRGLNSRYTIAWTKLLPGVTVDVVMSVVENNATGLCIPSWLAAGTHFFALTVNCHSFSQTPVIRILSNSDTITRPNTSTLLCLLINLNRIFNIALITTTSYRNKMTVCYKESQRLRFLILSKKTIQQNTDQLNIYQLVS